MIKANLEVVGHKLVTINTKVAKGTIERTRRLKLELEGIDGDKKSRCTLMVDPALKDTVPLADIAEVTIVIRQVRMDLPAKADAAPAAAPRRSRPPAKGSKPKAPAAVQTAAI